MHELMRPVINFLNELDQDIEESADRESPLLRLVNEANYVTPESLTSAMAFRAPARGEVVMGPRMSRITYFKPRDDIDLLKKELNISTITGVGEKTFDIVLDDVK